MSALLSSQRGQTSFEAVMIAGIVITISSLLGSYYLGDVADQTTAVIILKSELLKELNKLDTTYVIVSSLEPTLEADGALCFDVKTRPNDAPITSETLTQIGQKIVEKTKYDNITINLNSSGAC